MSRYTATVIVEELWYNGNGDPRSSIIRSEVFDDISAARMRQRALDREYDDNEACFTDIIVEVEK